MEIQKENPLKKKKTPRLSRRVSPRVANTVTYTVESQLKTGSSEDDSDSFPDLKGPPSPKLGKKSIVKIIFMDDFIEEDEDKINELKLVKKTIKKNWGKFDLDDVKFNR